MKFIFWKIGLERIAFMKQFKSNFWYCIHKKEIFWTVYVTI